MCVRCVKKQRIHANNLITTLLPTSIASSIGAHCVYWEISHWLYLKPYQWLVHSVPSQMVNLARKKGKKTTINYTLLWLFNLVGQQIYKTIKKRCLDKIKNHYGKWCLFARSIQNFLKAFTETLVTIDVWIVQSCGKGIKDISIAIKNHITIDVFFWWFSSSIT
jgi:hypothetical protein